MDIAGFSRVKLTPYNVEIFSRVKVGGKSDFQRVIPQGESLRGLGVILKFSIFGLIELILQA